MELLIPGLILVALMVYASTKIKKHAALAFEPELIDTDEFSIKKCAGFINPLNGDKEHAFEAYSKDFGTDAAQNMRQVSARISVFPDADFDKICEGAKQSVTDIISETSAGSGDSRTCVIEAESAEKGVPVEAYYKIAAGNSKIYELKISVLPEHKGEYLHRIEEMIGSFSVK